MKWIGCVLLGMIAACSMGLDWNASGLACDPQQTCTDGYSCMPEGLGAPSGCLPERSVEGGGICATDGQCIAGLICAGHRCHVPCTLGSALYEPDACGAGAVCANVSDTAVPVGACVAGDACIPQAACVVAGVSQGRCVSISKSAQVCLSACEIHWQDGRYTDTCSEDEFCQPLGVPHARSLVCLPTNISTGTAPGSGCGVSALACAPAQLCHHGVCAHHCDLAALDSFCGEGMRCCALPLTAAADAPFAGVCARQCR